MSLFGPPNIEKLAAKGNVKGLIRALKYYADVQSEAGKAARALGKTGDARAVNPLLEMAAREVNRDDYVQGTSTYSTPAMIAIGDIGAAALKPLIAALTARDLFTRMRAAEGLGWLRDARAVPSLLKALQDPHPGMRRQAIHTLGQIGDAQAVEPLIQALSNKNVDWVAAYALGRLGDRRAVEPLLKALAVHDPELRGAAIRALGELKDEWAVPALVAALADRTEFVRKAAMRALAEIGDRRVVNPIAQQLLQDRSPDLVQALDRLGWTPGDDEASAVYWTLKRNWQECVKIGAPAVGPLIKTLLEERLTVRAGAAQALVDLYQSGRLDAASMQLILKQREMIEFHEDTHGDSADEDFDFERKSPQGYHSDHADSGKTITFPG